VHFWLFLTLGRYVYRSILFSDFIFFFLPSPHISIFFKKIEEIKVSKIELASTRTVGKEESGGFIADGRN
jgi:hypothetical protein